MLLSGWAAAGGRSPGRLADALKRLGSTNGPTPPSVYYTPWAIAPFEGVGAKVGVRTAAACAALGARLVRERHLEVLEAAPALGQLLECVALGHAPAGAPVAELGAEAVYVLDELF